MKFIKSIILLLVVFGVAAGFALIKKKAQPITDKLGMIKKVNDFVSQKSQSLSPLAQDAQEQLQVLEDRGQEIGKHTQKVLGETIKVNQEADQNKRPLPERAFEYGKYLYCKQVVSDYESKK